MSGRQLAVRWSAVPGRVSATDLALLDGRGRHRAGTITHDAVRARHVTAWALLRRLLAAVEGGGDPATVAVDVDPDGRPVTGTSTAVSIAHTVDLVVVAVCLDGPVGVDVERRDRRPLPAPTTWCTPAEVATWTSLLPAVRDPWLLRRWTAKEAAFKAGAGWGGAVDRTWWLDPTGAHVVTVVT